MRKLFYYDPSNKVKWNIHTNNHSSTAVGIIVTFHLCLCIYQKWLLYISQAKFFSSDLPRKGRNSRHCLTWSVYLSQLKDRIAFSLVALSHLDSWKRNQRQCWHSNKHSNFIERLIHKERMSDLLKKFWKIYWHRWDSNPRLRRDFM